MVKAPAPIFRIAIEENSVMGEAARKVIGTLSLARIDYRELADAETLQPMETVRPNSLIALAVFFGQTRLIDNLRLP